MRSELALDLDEREAERRRSLASNWSERLERKLPCGRGLAEWDEVCGSVAEGERERKEWEEDAVRGERWGIETRVGKPKAYAGGAAPEPLGRGAHAGVAAAGPDIEGEADVASARAVVGSAMGSCLARASSSRRSSNRASEGLGFVGSGGREAR
jgi:hypothetical protein